MKRLIYKEGMNNSRLWPHLDTFTGSAIARIIVALLSWPKNVKFGYAIVGSRESMVTMN
jgi:hypothetical protein